MLLEIRELMFTIDTEHFTNVFQKTYLDHVRQQLAEPSHDPVTIIEQLYEDMWKRYIK